MILVGRTGWPTYDIASPVTKFEVTPKTHILLLDALLDGNGPAFVDVLKHHVLPCFTLGLLLCGVFIRLVRVNLLQTLKGDYVEAARARGIPERFVIRRHAFRNALVPVVTVIGLQVALTMSGAVLTESTFNWPGLGTELIDYLNARDYSAVQGLVTFFALIVVVVSLLVDIVNAAHRPASELLRRPEESLLAPCSRRSATPAAWPAGSWSPGWSSPPRSWSRPCSRRGSRRTGFAQFSAHGQRFPKMAPPS